MNRLFAVTLGLGLATGAFAQDARFVEYDEVDECGDVVGGGEWVPRTRAHSRTLDSIEDSIDRALGTIGECTEDIGCNGGGGPDLILKGACERLLLLLEGGGMKDNLHFYGVIDLVCSEGGGGGGGSCGGQPDNAAATRAILIHDGYVLHDTAGQEEFNEQSP